MAYNCEERIGVYSVSKIFTETLGWIFREQPINDFGVDAIPASWFQLLGWILGPSNNSALFESAVSRTVIGALPSFDVFDHSNINKMERCSLTLITPNL